MLEKLYISSYEEHQKNIGFLKMLFILTFALSVSFFMFSSLILYFSEDFTQLFPTDKLLTFHFYTGLSTVFLLAILYFRYRKHRLDSTQYLKSINLDFATPIKLIDIAHTAVNVKYKDSSPEIIAYLNNLVDHNFSSTKTMKAYCYLDKDKSADFHWDMRDIFSTVKNYEDIKRFTK